MIKLKTQTEQAIENKDRTDNPDLADVNGVDEA